MNGPSPEPGQGSLQDQQRAWSSGADQQLAALELQEIQLEALTSAGAGAFSGEFTSALAAIRGEIAMYRNREERAQRARAIADGVVADLAERAQAPAPTLAEPSPRPAQPGGRRAAVAYLRPRRVIDDADGYDLRPNPLSARTEAELMATLRRFRLWAGEPSYRQISQVARKGRLKVGVSTLCTALNSDTLPSLAVMLAAVTGCGGDGEDQRRFATAWRTLRLAEGEHGQQTAQESRRGLRAVPAELTHQPASGWRRLTPGYLAPQAGPGQRLGAVRPVPCH